jgi:hypothetical protein
LATSHLAGFVPSRLEKPNGVSKHIAARIRNDLPVERRFGENPMVACSVTSFCQIQALMSDALR